MSDYSDLGITEAAGKQMDAIAEQHDQTKPDWMCSRPKCRNEREGWGREEYPSNQCASHNDRDIEHARERAEWTYYHPKSPKGG